MFNYIEHSKTHREIVAAQNVFNVSLKLLFEKFVFSDKHLPTDRKKCALVSTLRRRIIFQLCGISNASTDFSRIPQISNFIEIRPVVLNLLKAYRRTDVQSESTNMRCIGFRKTLSEILKHWNKLLVSVYSLIIYKFYIFDQEATTLDF